VGVPPREAEAQGATRSAPSAAGLGGAMVNAAPTVTELPTDEPLGRMMFTSVRRPAVRALLGALMTGAQRLDQRLLAT
jgi:hypothetical protein